MTKPNTSDQNTECSMPRGTCRARVVRLFRGVRRSVEAGDRVDRIEQADQERRRGPCAARHRRRRPVAGVVDEGRQAARDPGSAQRRARSASGPPRRRRSGSREKSVSAVVVLMPKWLNSACVTAISVIRRCTCCHVEQRRSRSTSMPKHAEPGRGRVEAAGKQPTFTDATTKIRPSRLSQAVTQPQPRPPRIDAQ